MLANSWSVRRVYSRALEKGEGTLQASLRLDHPLENGFKLKNTSLTDWTDILNHSDVLHSLKNSKLWILIPILLSIILGPHFQRWGCRGRQAKKVTLSQIRIYCFFTSPLSLVAGMSPLKFDKVGCSVSQSYTLVIKLLKKVWLTFQLCSV